MTHKITTGPFPGHAGSCIAQYNHTTLQHTTNHHSPHQLPINSQNQHPMNVQGQYGIPTWRPPGASYPSWY